MNELQQAFLDEYLSSLPESENTTDAEVIAEYYCADEYNANECARLVNAGFKKASCSLKAAYDLESESLPKIGQLTVVLNWAQEPVCIVKMTDVSICPFNQVTPEFAKLEGEGDGSYKWWKEAHIAFFTEYAAQEGLEFNENSELVLERFEKVYPT